MKIYVSQGHEKGIGLEVFIKSFLLMPESSISLIELVTFKESLISTLKTLGLPYSFNESAITVGGRSLSVQWMSSKNNPQSFICLKRAMELAESNRGVLFTLPTSKDQFPQGLAGHTEFFRSHYKKPELGMFFSSPGLEVLLLTDHVSLHSLSDVLTEELIYTRLKEALNTFARWHHPTKRIFISGINPHAGEGGLIGNEDQRISAAIARLKTETKLEMRGPLPGDTMLLEQNDPFDLLVYMYHDQGLGVFKGLKGFIGSNITLGLPYPRVSPDHGTSFNLFGKNIADYRGCEFALKQAVSLLKKVVDGKNSGHQGQGT